ncbi:MAG TPA: SEC-C metal-binding domain-containing protein [Bdellovibrionales bacterium]|nr:SEC-C metal-binding domain-containing protein [Bdellovibrionales bacterium]
MEKLVEPQNARIYDLKSFDRNKRIKIDDALINELKTYGEVNAADPWNDYESFNLTEDKEGGVFQSDGQAMYFYREFFGLWNELSKFQTELFQLPIGLLGKDANGLDDKALNSMKIFWTKMRLLAFSQGLSMGNTDEERFAGTPIGDFIEYIESKVGQFDELEDEKRYSSEVVDGLLAEVEFFWNQYYLPFANSCRDFCRQEIERQKFVEENKNVGRNEPCPCGSGKKFKKCCMVIH